MQGRRQGQGSGSGRGHRHGRGSGFSGYCISPSRGAEVLQEGFSIFK